MTDSLSQDSDGDEPTAVDITEQSLEERMLHLRANSDNDGFVSCSIEGAKFVRRPCVSRIEPIEHIVEWLDMEDEVDEPVDSLALAEELGGKTLPDDAPTSGTIEFKPFYELAIQTLTGQKFVCTANFEATSSNLSVYDLHAVVELIDELELRFSETSEYKADVQFGDYLLDSQVVIATQDEYSFEWAELVSSEPDFTPVKDCRDVTGWIETSVSIDDGDGVILLTTEYLDEEITWEFEEPTTWSESNEYVRFVEEFAYGNPMNVEEEIAYIRYTEDTSGDTHTSTDGWFELLLDAEELTTRPLYSKEQNTDSASIIHTLLSQVRRILSIDALVLLQFFLMLFSIFLVVSVAVMATGQL